MSAPATCWEDAYRVQTETIKELRAENAALLVQNAALLELLNEPYQFFQIGYDALQPWGDGIENWCRRAEKFGVKKEGQP